MVIHHPLISRWQGYKLSWWELHSVSQRMSLGTRWPVPMDLQRYQNTQRISFVCNSLTQVFRLAQLIIQYLVHCQQQLTDQLAAKEQQKKEVVEEKEKATSFANALEEEVKVLRKENKKRRKMLTAQQECLFKGTNLRDFQKCSFCPKTFINQSFLTSHLARRHGQVASKPADGGEGEVGEQLRSLVRSMKEELAVGREGRMEELTSLVRRQQEQMEKLQETLKERTEEKEKRKEQPKEEVEGRMQAQERFWQAQVKTIVSLTFVTNCLF